MKLPVVRSWCLHLACPRSKWLQERAFEYNGPFPFRLCFVSQKRTTKLRGLTMAAWPCKSLALNPCSLLCPCPSGIAHFTRICLSLAANVDRPHANKSISRVTGSRNKEMTCRKVYAFDNIQMLSNLRRLMAILASWFGRYY